MTHFSRILRAVSLAAPTAMAEQYPGTSGHCLDASVAIVSVLARHHVRARPVACALTAFSLDPAACVAVGHDADSFRAWCLGRGVPVAAYALAQFRSGAHLTPDELSTYIAVEATHGARRAFLDVCTGHVRDRSLGVICGGETVLVDDYAWPVRVEPVLGAYLDYVRRDWRGPGPAPWRGHAAPKELVGRLGELVGLALRCELDREAFEAALSLR